MRRKQNRDVAAEWRRHGAVARHEKTKKKPATISSLPLRLFNFLSPLLSSVTLLLVTVGSHSCDVCVCVYIVHPCIACRSGMRCDHVGSQRGVHRITRLQFDWIKVDSKVDSASAEEM